MRPNRFFAAGFALFVSGAILFAVSEFERSRPLVISTNVEWRNPGSSYTADDGSVAHMFDEVTETRMQQFASSSRPTVAVFVGTRPEAVKLAPLVAEMRRDSNAAVFNTAVISTGQHREMLLQMFQSFHIDVDVELSLMRPDQTPAGLLARALDATTAVLQRIQPAVVIVQGDTTTALAGALAAFFLRIPVAHVEAGLRSYDMDNPFPEELNRRAIDGFAAFHFAPTEYAAEALRREAICGREIHVTGNTGVDAILHALKRSPPPAAENILSMLDSAETVVLVTSHRRENLGGPLANICRAIRRLVTDYPSVTVVFPVHLNPNVRKVVHTLLRGVPRVITLDPLSYDILPFVMRRADLIMSDSGGIQEEAVSIGKPVILLRRTTERPEGVFAGTVRISGTDEQDLYDRGSSMLDNLVSITASLRAQNVFGYGNASQITSNVLRNFLQLSPEKRAELLSGCTDKKQGELAQAVYGFDALKKSREDNAVPRKDVKTAADAVLDGVDESAVRMSLSESKRVDERGATEPEASALPRM